MLFLCVKPSYVIIVWKNIFVWCKWSPKQDIEWLKCHRFWIWKTNKGIQWSVLYWWTKMWKFNKKFTMGGRDYWDKIISKNVGQEKKMKYAKKACISNPCFISTQHYTLIHPTQLSIKKINNIPSCEQLLFEIIYT